MSVPLDCFTFELHSKILARVLGLGCRELEDGAICHLSVLMPWRSAPSLACSHYPEMWRAGMAGSCPIAIT